MQLPKRVVSLIIAIAFLLATLTLYLLGAANLLIPFGFTARNTPYVDPHLLDSDLGLTITALSSKPPTIRVTITNYHPETTVSLLIWDTPLDDLAPSLGIFSFTQQKTGDSFQFQKFAPQRPTEPPEEAFYELLPMHAVTKDLVLSDPASSSRPYGQLLIPGNDYIIEVKGDWQAFWSANVTKLGSERLKKMGGGFGLHQGPFRASGIVHVD